MHWIVIIVSLLLATATGYFFLIWWSSSPKEKIITIAKKYEKSEGEYKTFLAKVDSDLTGAKTEADGLATSASSEEQKKAYKEIKSVLQEVKTKEELTKKTYSYWDYGYAGGVIIVSFIAKYFLIKMVLGSAKSNDE